MVDNPIVATEFRAGGVLARSFSTLFRNIVPFGLLALVISAPPYVYGILFNTVDSLDSGNLEFGYSAAGVIVTIAQYLLAYILTAALVYGTIQDLRGRGVNFGECFSKGVSLMFPVLGVAIVSGILTGLAFIVPLMLTFILSPFAIPVLIIPGLIVLMMLWVTIPVAVIERRGLGSLGRSAELTKGYRWRVFFLFIILFLILIGASILVGILTTAITFSAISDTGEISGASLTGLLAIQWVFSAFISALTAVIVAVSYHDLRVAKEGVDTDQIASVFD